MAEMKIYNRLTIEKGTGAVSSNTIGEESSTEECIGNLPTKQKSRSNAFSGLAGRKIATSHIPHFVAESGAKP
jgi:hypothetical protein